MTAQGVVDLARALPGVVLRERDDWTSVTFRGKGFAWVDHADDRAMVKSTHDERSAMVATDPDAYAEGWASSSTAWVLITLRAADPDEVAEVLLDAWRMTATRRAVAAYDAAAGRAHAAPPDGPDPPGRRQSQDMPRSPPGRP
jgi:hypothetical protein